MTRRTESVGLFDPPPDASPSPQKGEGRVRRSHPESLTAANEWAAWLADPTLSVDDLARGLATAAWGLDGAELRRVAEVVGELYRWRAT